MRDADAPTAMTIRRAKNRRSPQKKQTRPFPRKHYYYYYHYSTQRASCLVFGTCVPLLPGKNEQNPIACLPACLPASFDKYNIDRLWPTREEINNYYRNKCCSYRVADERNDRCKKKKQVNNYSGFYLAR